MNSLKLNNLPVHYRALALLAVVAVVLALDAAFFNSALAGGAEDVFKKGEEKGNDLVALIKGKMAVVICAAVIGITGILMLFGRVSHYIGIRICIGAFTIGSCYEIASWLMS